MTLRMLGDPRNQARTITHVLYNRPSRQRVKGLKYCDYGRVSTYKGIQIISEVFEDIRRPSVHDGRAVVLRLLSLGVRHF